MDWNIPNLLSISLYTLIFIKNRHVKKTQNLLLIVHAAFMAIANFYYGASIYIFLNVVFIVIFGASIQYLNKLNVIKDKDFNKHFGFYNAMPWFFSIQMLLSWAGVN